MAKQPRSLANRLVAIAGGARGIGRCTAEALVREGAWHLISGTPESESLQPVPPQLLVERR